MKEGIKTFKFNFHASLGDFLLNAPSISSPLIATWKRSSQSVSTSSVDMTGGKANFNQTITLQLNMYYEEANQVFQQKKTLFTFTMQTPKGEKQAGVVYVELSQMLNNKIQTFTNVYPLEKCPVKDSKVSISITAQLVGQASISDNMSVDSSILNQSAGPSTLSIESKRIIPQSSSKIKEESSKIKDQQKQEKSIPTLTQTSESSSQLKQKIKTIETLQGQIQKLTKQKEALAKQLEREKSKNAGSEANSLKQQLIKSKNIQQKLQSEINNLRSQNIEHQRELQKMRIRMEQIYELLFSNLNSLY